MREESESSTDGPFKLSERQGMACLFWADHRSLQRPSGSLGDSQFAALPEELRRWCLAHLPAGNVTVAPVTLDEQAVEHLLEALLACLKGLVLREEPAQHELARAPSPPANANPSNARRRERPLPEVAITTFGRFTLCSSGQEMKLPARNGDRLCKILLCQPGRQAESAWLLEQLWPEADGDLASTYLYNAAYTLRQTLPKGMLLTHKATQSYQLAGQERLWVDADAATQLLLEAETLGRATAQALPR